MHEYELSILITAECCCTCSLSEMCVYIYIRNTLYLLVKVGEIADVSESEFICVLFEREYNCWHVYVRKLAPNQHENIEESHSKSFNLHTPPFSFTTFSLN